MRLPVSHEYLGMALDPPEFARIAWGDTVLLREERAGMLKVPSGCLVACDPIVSFPGPSFTRNILPGEYEVRLVVAIAGEDNHRNAFAVIDLSGEKETVVDWTMFVDRERSPAEMEDGAWFGYPVDGGTGCFYDGSLLDHLRQPDSRNLWQKLQKKPLPEEAGPGRLSPDDFSERILVEFVEREVGQVNLTPSDESPNLIAFTSGFGDGYYATYAGTNADGKVVAVVTDFRVLKDPSGEF